MHNLGAADPCRAVQGWPPVVVKENQAQFLSMYCGIYGNNQNLNILAEPNCPKFTSVCLVEMRRYKQIDCTTTFKHPQLPLHNKSTKLRGLSICQRQREVYSLLTVL